MMLERLLSFCCLIVAAAHQAHISRSMIHMAKLAIFMAYYYCQVFIIIQYYVM